jgi:glycosyltransferase involved in cell wall biosynthesis
MLKSVPKDQMLQYYNAADLFTMPSVREAFPLAMLEAMACDLPVVTVHEGSRATIGDGCVEYCDPEDEVGYADAIDRALQNEHFEVSRKRIMEYSIENVGNTWAELLREVMVT